MFPQIKNYIDKMEEINLSIEELEKQIKGQEAKNVGKTFAHANISLERRTTVKGFGKDTRRCFVSTSTEQGRSQYDDLSTISMW